MPGFSTRAISLVAILDRTTFSLRNIGLLNVSQTQLAWTDGMRQLAVL